MMGRPLPPLQQVRHVAEPRMLHSGLDAVRGLLHSPPLQLDMQLSKDINSCVACGMMSSLTDSFK
jgi:hypothetical protein